MLHASSCPPPTVQRQHLKLMLITSSLGYRGGGRGSATTVPLFNQQPRLADLLDRCPFLLRNSTVSSLTRGVEESLLPLADQYCLLQSRAQEQLCPSDTAHWDKVRHLPDKGGHPFLVNDLQVATRPWRHSKQALKEFSQSPVAHPWNLKPSEPEAGESRSFRK